MSTAESVECSKCGAGNRPQAKFCGTCGGLLAAELHARGAVRAIRARSASVTSAAPSWAPGPDRRNRRARPVPKALADGRYTLGRLLGEGGGKRVYLATDTRLQREVAAAVFKAGGSDQTAMRRARREAEAMAKLGEHPTSSTSMTSAKRRGSST